MVDFPPTSNPWWLLAAFFGALLVFHVVFVGIWKLGKLGWKLSDYVWLAIATLGLIGVATDTRREFSEWVGDYYDVGVNLSYATFHVALWSLHDVTHDPSRESDGELGGWRSYAEVLLNTFPLHPSDVADLDFGIIKQIRPQVSNRLLLDALATVDTTASMCSSLVRARTNLVNTSRRSSFEVDLAIISPFLLAVALALRITKVTGEIGIERRRPPTVSLPSQTSSESPPAVVSGVPALTLSHRPSEDAEISP